MTKQLSSPRSVAIIKEQLADLEKVKSSINHNEPFDASMKSSIRSLKRHEEELKEELRAAELLESADDIELSFDGGLVENHGMDFDFFTTIMKPLDEICKFLSKGQSIAKGFQIKGFVASSFAVRIALPKPPKPKKQRTMFQNDIICATQLFTDIFSGNADAGDPHFRDPKIRQHYNEFLSMLAENNLSLAVRTKVAPYASTFNKDDVSQRIERIRRYEAITVEASLVMGELSQTAKRFKAKSGIVTFSGAVNPAALEGKKIFPVGDDVEARILLPSSESVEKAIEDSKATEGRPREISGCELLTFESNEGTGPEAKE